MSAMSIAICRSARYFRLFVQDVCRKSTLVQAKMIQATMQIRPEIARARNSPARRGKVRL